MHKLHVSMYIVILQLKCDFAALIGIICCKTSIDLFHEF